ncbi:MAG: IPT/TIG domain-containing protein [Candidatus Aenigmarchaeota archaeon]|nr:IPT/TIG domain-containing protein [Candidatus Aenigmarchaeota archaeon]
MIDKLLVSLIAIGLVTGIGVAMLVQQSPFCGRGVCPDGTEYDKYSFVDGQCVEIQYIRDPCGQLPSQTAWYSIDPVQCNGNQWDQWWDQQGTPGVRQPGNPQLIVSSYLSAVHNIEVLDFKDEVTQEIVCQACSCPTGHTYSILIGTSEARLLPLGWTKVLPLGDNQQCEIGVCPDGTTYQKYFFDGVKCVLVNYIRDPCGPLPALEKPAIAGVFPQAGAVGSSVTISGSGFTAEGNSVYFSSNIVGSYDSNGNTIIFTIPPEFASGCDAPCESAEPPEISPGSYMFTVVNAGGTSNEFEFTVTSSSPPTIAGISPSSGPEGTAVAISGENLHGGRVYFGSEQNWGGATSSSDGKALTFTVIGSPCEPPYGCAYSPFDPGTYSVYVVTVNGRSNSVQFTVTA